MANVGVLLDGTRINASDSGTSWAKINISGPAPIAEAQLAYQGGLAVNVKNTNTGALNFGGLGYDPGSGAIDMTSSSYPLAFMKVYVADFGALRTDDAVRARIGSANNHYYDYVLSGASATRQVFSSYPNQGGYILASINPNISSWRYATAGTPSLPGVDYFAGLSVFNTGGAKSENFAVDAIDAGKGLVLFGGDAGSTEGNFLDFVTFDQNNTTNRWGVISTKAGVIYSTGMLTIGSNATPTEFIDGGSDLVVFPDGYYGPGNVGTTFDISNASSVITLSSSQMVGRGSPSISDTRPDFTVTGTSGAFSMDGMALTNFRNVTLTSKCSIINVDLECVLLTQSSAHVSDSVIRTNSLASVSCLQDPTFGTNAGVHDTEFVQSGAGHAIRLSTAQIYTLTNLTFTGYGADTTNSSALKITAASGNVTINYNTPVAPTYTTAGANVALNNPVTLNINIVDTDGNAITANCEVTVVRNSDSVILFEEDNITDGTATYNYSSGGGTVTYINVHNVAGYLNRTINNYTLPSTGTNSLDVQLETDRFYST